MYICCFIAGLPGGPQMGLPPGMAPQGQRAPFHSYQQGMPQQHQGMQQQTGMPQPGMPQPGMPQPGMQQMGGMQQQQPVMQQPGMQVGTVIVTRDSS